MTIQAIVSIALCILCSAKISAGAGITSSNAFTYPEYSKTISMDFKDAVLNDVLKIFSQQSGLNFIASQNVAERKVTLFLDKVPVEEALERILSANDLAYEIEPGSNIFIVKPSTRPAEELLTRIYNLKHATVRSSKLNSTVSILSDGESSQSSGESGASTTNEFGNSAGIVAAIKTVLSRFGSIIEDPRTNSLVVTDLPRQFPLIEQAISRLDMPVPQILIEVEMLDVSKETGEQLGVKYGDTPLTFKGGERDVVYPWNQNRLLDKGFTFEDPEYRVGTISAAGLTMALQFLKSQTDTKNLARPRILTLNNETAQIMISTDEAIGIQTQTQSSEGSATSSVTAERVKTGVFLTVTPQVNLATREITLAIVPKVIEARTGGTFSGTTFKDPEERGTKSILRVHDNDTIVLGGLLRTDYSNTITKLPILGDLPVVGAVFRHKDKTATDRELIIFITPRITDSASELAMTKPQKLTREQELPPSRRKEIDSALTTAENQRR